MIIKKEEREAIGRSGNRVLKEVLERELKIPATAVKTSKDILDIRYQQGVLYVIEELLKFVK